MRPLSLHLENVRTFDVLDFEFPEGACAIVGPNGSGKSTTVSALDVGLFGAEGRSLADWLSKDRPEQTMVILLAFEHGADRFRVRRTFDGRGRGKSATDFEQEIDDGRWMPLTRESSATTQEAIEEIIGLDRASFRASAFMAQGEGSLFCQMTPGQRKDLLSRVLGLGVWDSYRDRARVDLRAAEQSLAVVRAKIEGAETELAGKPQIESEALHARAREEAARTALGECGSQLAKARERLSALREAAGLREAAERARDAAERAHASLLERIAGLEEQIREAEGRLAEREGLEVLAEGLPGLECQRDALAEQAQGAADLERLIRENTTLTRRMNALQVKIADLMIKAEQAKGTTERVECDRCGRELADEYALRAAKSYEEEADLLQVGEGGRDETLAMIRFNESEMRGLPPYPPDENRVRQVADLIRLGQDAKVQLAALHEVTMQANAAAQELSKVRAELPEREASIESARARMGALGPHDPGAIPKAQVETVRLETVALEQRTTLDNTLSEIARLDERLARLDELAGDTQEATSQGQSLEAEVELLSHLERACGQNGVPALILETSAIPQLEAEWNRVLRLLPTESGDIFEVELHTQRERKSGEGAVDALDIVVYANGHARPYASYSGGERARIDIAQRRALSALLTNRKGAECPLMILDEPNSLDDQGMAALAQVLEDLAASEGLTILVVSHDPALRDAFEQSITIEKGDGRSRLVGATEPAPIMEVA